MAAEAQKKILVIDDDRIARNSIANLLADEFNIESAENGEEGLRKAVDWHPQLILLDVEMPGKNGYEVCDSLKTQDGTKNIPVIFISSHNDLRERMLGYEVGAEDYLVKPCDAEILKVKVHRLVTAREEKDQLSIRAKQAQETALEAMTGSSELGKAVRFVEATYSIGSFKELAALTFQLAADLELSTSIMFVTSEGEQFFSQQMTSVSPLEKDLMRMLHGTSRFYDFGCRTQVNYSNFSFLIKNMPLQDRERYGRLKDLLPFVMGAADEKARILDTERALRLQASNLSRSVQAVKLTLTEITQSIQSNQEDITKAVRLLLQQLEDQLPKMGLEDDQEALIIRLVDEGFNSTVNHMENSAALRASLDGVVRLLQYLTDEQHQLMESAVSHSSIKQGSEIDLNNVELF